MKFNFQNLDNSTRQLMLKEIKYDTDRNQLYFSKRFNEVGHGCYHDLLQQAATSGDEETLGNALKTNACFKSHEERKTKSGISLAKVPETANVTLAESEFNRFLYKSYLFKIHRNWTTVANLSSKVF